MPLLRYWTGDITTLDPEPCRCGRTLARMGLIKGRTDDMLIIRGVNLYPTQIESVLGGVPELSPHYRLVVTREGTLDEVTVETEVTEEHARGSSDLASDPLAMRVAHLIKDTIGVTVGVSLLGPGEGPRSEGGKLARVDDRRKLA
jgi:phenylacetate-CoA ligase